MKKWSLGVAVFLLLTSAGIIRADSTSGVNPCRRVSSKAEALQRGCCSWHGGVCGCIGNLVQCCDYTISPTCKCE